MRYHAKTLVGRHGDSERVKAVILLDDETGFMFFLSKSPALVNTSRIHGGCPYDINPDPAWWDVRNIACYNLGTGHDMSHTINACDHCGNPLIKSFEWHQADDSVVTNFDTFDKLDALLSWTIVYGARELGSWVDALGGNTDYDGDPTVASGSSSSGSSSSRKAVEPTSVSSLESPNYTTDYDYYGMHSYHAHHGRGCNVPKDGYDGYRIGVELEVECLNSSKKARLNDIHSNWFYQERDGSLGEYGVELITIPLKPDDARSPEFWKPFTDAVGSLATSWECRTTGLHVHISRSILGDSAEERSEVLGKLLFFYHHIILDDSTAKRISNNIYGREHTYHEIDGKTEAGHAGKVLKSALAVKAVQKQISDAMQRKCSDDRYFDINTLNENTIEFRKGKGSIHKGRITNIIAWCELMCLYCRKTKWENLSFDAFRSYVRDSSIAPETLKALV